MKNEWLYLLIGIASLGSCQKSPNENAEECSVKISGIEFTKSLNQAKSMVTVEGDKLIFKSGAKSDYFNEPDGQQSYHNAPVLLTKVDNTKPFTFLAKVTPSFTDTYDAGAMYIYLNDTQWFKFAFERDERKRTRIVTVRTISTSDDNNHDAVDSASVYMKISSDTRTIGFYYSTDQENWQLVRLFRNEYPAETWIGLSTQSPIGNGTIGTFEECSFTQSSVKDFRMGI
jgi:hypothetical protein